MTTLTFSEKIDVLKAYLEDEKDNYADSFKSDIYFFFNEFEDLDEIEHRLGFLKTLHTTEDIQNWVDHLTSRIVLKYDEDEMELSEFLFLEVGG